jgi:hypothetical protein
MAWEWFYRTCFHRNHTLQSPVSMSNSLTKSFEHINLRPSLQLSLHNEPNKGPAPPIQLTIPQLITHGRRMYFGFETTEKWLIEYAKTEFRKRGYTPNPPPSDLLYMSESLQLLQDHSGIHHVRVKSVFPQGTRIPPRPKDNRQTFPLRKSGGTIVAICSSSSSWFPKRPSQAQVDVLKQIMGGKEPKWWVSDI